MLIDKCSDATIANCLALAVQKIDKFEAEILLAELLQCNRVYLRAYPEKQVGQKVYQQFHQWVNKRRDGFPVAYLLGHKEFYALDFMVSPDVLIPRPETELIVDISRQLWTNPEYPNRILDLGTGSGILAITLAKYFPDSQVVALDKSEAALQIAYRNAMRHQVKVAFVASYWFSALKQHPYNLVVANPPYIAQGDRHLHQGDLRYEPSGALSSPDHGFADLQHIITQARAYLHPNAWLLLEHGYDQAEWVNNCLRQQGFINCCAWKDLSGIIRVSGGQKCSV